jgi:hypothetical protein
MKTYIAVLVLGVSMALVGCTKSQSENCKKLIACTESLNPGSGAAMESAYGKDGACWKDSASADACTKACDTAMGGLKAMPNFGSNAACK